MDLPTYTNIWRIEKRLYKLYDFRLPMPLPINWIAVFAGITIPYIVLLIAIGLPFNHTLVWLYVLPPGVLTWLTTRPVIENKRLPELVESQARYLTEPKTWVRLVPLSEKDTMVLSARVWHSRRTARRRRAHRAPRAGRASRPERREGSSRSRDVAAAGAAAPGAGPQAHVHLPAGRPRAACRRLGRAGHRPRPDASARAPRCRRAPGRRSGPALRIVPAHRNASGWPRSGRGAPRRAPALPAGARAVRAAPPAVAAPRTPREVAEAHRSGPECR